MSVSPTLIASPTSTITSGPYVPLSPTPEIFALSAGALIVLLICVTIAFIFGRKLQQSTINREPLLKAVAEEEKIRRVRQLDNDKWSGPIDNDENPLPYKDVGGYNAYYFWENQKLVLDQCDTAPSNQAEVEDWEELHRLKVWGQKELAIYQKKLAEIQKTAQTEAENRARTNELDNLSYSGPISLDENPLPNNIGNYSAYYFWDHRKEVLALSDTAPNNQAEKDDWQKLHALKLWGQKELLVYAKKVKKIEQEASDYAAVMVPPKSTVSRSGGFTFILEFSTIIVIIFALVILGLLQVLSGNEINGILAAIAGYVLGRAATTAQTAKAETTPKEQN
jgi:hypothetical protein